MLELKKEYIGRWISLIAKSDERYEGRLSDFNDHIITLQGMECCDTKWRRISKKPLYIYRENIKCLILTVNAAAEKAATAKAAAEEAAAEKAAAEKAAAEKAATEKAAAEKAAAEKAAAEKVAAEKAAAEKATAKKAEAEKAAEKAAAEKAEKVAAEKAAAVAAEKVAAEKAAAEKAAAEKVAAETAAVEKAATEKAAAEKAAAEKAAAEKVAAEKVAAEKAAAEKAAAEKAAAETAAVEKAATERAAAEKAAPQKALEKEWILKLKHADHVYRVPCADPIELEDVWTAIEATLGLDRETSLAKYLDAEDDLCTMCASTFADFKTHVREETENRNILKLHIDTSLPLGLRRSCDSVPEAEGQPSIASDVSHVHDVSSLDGGSEEFVIVSSDRNGHCFLKNTVLRTRDSGLKSMDAVKVGDKICGGDGQELEVAYKHVHQQMNCILVTLRTPQAEVTVTADHRIRAPRCDDGEKMAKDLLVGDIVICGNREQKLTKIKQSEECVELVELRFNPDLPVETFMVARYGILTKGAQMPGAMRGMGPRGPYTFETRTQTSNAEMRSRSA